jgi:hypothetical protein
MIRSIARTFGESENQNEIYPTFLRFSKKSRTDFYHDAHQIIRIAKAPSQSSPLSKVHAPGRLGA